MGRSACQLPVRRAASSVRHWRPELTSLGGQSGCPSAGSGEYTEKLEGSGVRQFHPYGYTSNLKLSSVIHGVHVSVLSVLVHYRMETNRCQRSHARREAGHVVSDSNPRQLETHLDLEVGSSIGDPEGARYI